MYQDEIIKQREYFYSNKTLDVKFRKDLLKKLLKEIKQQEDNIYSAIKLDLGKSKSEAYMCEVGLVLSELNYLIKNIKKFSKKHHVRTPLAHFASSSYQKACPYGNTLIISPWNYPFLLSMDPLISSVSAGNTVILKPSEFSINTNKVIKNIIQNVFVDDHVLIIEGDKEASISLLKEKFDYIFFTGNQEIGRSVYNQASKHLTPVTLELGGKSPCIVDQTANIKLSAKRIVFGKFLNLGQTCVAPDYIICHSSIKDKFVTAIIEEVIKQYPNTLDSESYGNIITNTHYQRIKNLLINEKHKCIHGGNFDDNLLKIEPTIFDNITFEDEIMQNEIFGPLLPILSYEDKFELINKINSLSTPLACYVFSSDKKSIDLFTNNLYFGGGCINDTIVHLANSNLAFGGLKNSGMGSYHGKKSFETFSHYKSILDKKTWLDLPLRYRPYNKIKDLLIRFFVR